MSLLSLMAGLTVDLKTMLSEGLTPRIFMRHLNPGRTSWPSSL